ncbi:uncharacterized protein [Ptychodera flava]|uniref:uncharacterized protein n=1 Tax=Ptychodera flava TaxID=63121 RepID=UPI00396A7AAE
MTSASSNRFTGVTLIIFGIIYLGLGITFTILECYGFQIGFQLWAALVFLITGVFGVLANDKRKRDLIHGYTIFCVCCVIASLILITGLIIAIANEYFGGYCRWFDWFTIEGCSAPVARMVIDIVYLCFAVFGGIAAIGCLYVAGKISSEAEDERKDSQKVYDTKK